MTKETLNPKLSCLNQILFKYLAERGSYTKFNQIVEYFEYELKNPNFAFLLKRFFLYFFVQKKETLSPRALKRFAIQFRTKTRLQLDKYKD